MNFQGVFSVLPTPFLTNGEIDFVSLRKVVDLYINAGVNGLTALGVTSEVARLTERERFEVLDAVMDRVKGRVPVVVGSTADGLRTC
ncbi:MAG: dihydrodipicolinate synthase family protein, partial [Terriglobia bacterium]